MDTGKRHHIRSFITEIFYGFLTEYETPKIVMIHSYTVTTLLRIMQIILLLYSLFYLLLYEKGYQKRDTSIISSVTLKVKGIGYAYTATNQTLVIDGADYIVPPSEDNAIFIMTNFIQTDQSRAQCAESTSLLEAICKVNSDCQNRPFMSGANGRWTGLCLKPPEENNFNITKQPTGLCEIQGASTIYLDFLGWCPVEDDSQQRMVVNEILNFTIFIKNFIEFPGFNIKHKNMVENLKACKFDPIKNKDCPIFGLDHIINEAETDIHERRLMLQHGGVIRAKLDWDCNLDRHIRLCKPKYSFARLDSRNETFSIGFNFRFASHWKQDQTYLRSLKKAYGLRFIISVSGKAGKFDFITLTLNTGSLVGIFGLATFFCDIILLNLTKKATLYREHVFQRVSVPPSIKKHNQNISTVYENPVSNNEHSTTVYSTPESVFKFLHQTDVTDPYQSLKLQPSLGLTNIITNSLY